MGEYMGDIELRFESKWDYSFDAEMTAFKALLAKTIKKALKEVNVDMQDVLKKHIEKDVYDPSVYYPDEYVRRSENPGLGTPLSNLKANVLSPVTEADVINDTVAANTRFQYMPTGEHSVPKWSSAAKQDNPNFPKNLDGNELIRRIETKNPRYNWGQHKVPKRPFWQNTVDELIEGGAAADSFDRWMTQYGGTLEYEGGSTAVREPGDGEY